jgi:hypothetical protein
VDDVDLRALLPLQQLIDETIRTTPVMIGGRTDDLSALIAVRVAVWVGKNVLPTKP